MKISSAEWIPDDSSTMPSSTMPAPSTHNGREALLDVAVQQRVKSLIQQIKTAHQKQQLNPEVEAALSQLTAEIVLEQTPTAIMTLFKAALENKKLDLQEHTQLSQLCQQLSTQSKFDQLVDRVRQALQTQPFSHKIQTELAQLLTLLSKVNRTPDLVDEFDLAISALLAADLSHEQRQENIKFARNIRKQLSLKLKQNPNPLTSIIYATGSPHNRFISGLGWFFLLFAVGPLAISLTFFLLGLTRLANDLDQLRLANQTLETQLVSETIRSGALATEIEEINQLLPNIQINELTSISNLPETTEESPPSTLLSQQKALANQISSELNTQKELLERIESDIKSFEIELNSDGIIEETITGDFSRLIESLSVNYDDFQTSYFALSTLETKREAIANELESDLQLLREQISGLPSFKQHISLALLAYAKSLENQTIEGGFEARKGANTTLSGQSLALDNRQIVDQRLDLNNSVSTNRPLSGEMADDETQINKILNQINQLTNLPIGKLFHNINNGMINLPLVLTVLGTGALGSFVSVAVRADEFITKGEKNRLDLFLVGFFRPIMGMSFAFLLFAVIESGIFSGILSIDAMKPSKKIYLYIAISFVAGFSERLAKGIVGDTNRVC